MIRGLQVSRSVHVVRRTSPGTRVVNARADKDSKVVREYREDDDTVNVPGAKKGQQKNPDGTIYADEQADPYVDTMSDEMKKKLREEYVAWGGSANKPMANNYFLYVILFIAALVLLSAATGAI